MSGRHSLIGTTLFAALAGSGPLLAADADPATLEEIIVTATKKATALQDTPIAVTALGASELEAAHVNNLQDVVHLVPSFQATSEGDHGVVTLTLRGIGNDSAKTEYADPEVAMFINGIYSPRPEGAAALLFDMDSVEVLRGPQGTLWGRNSTVGAVNMQTARPTLDARYGSVEAGFGTYQRFGARGMLNLPLSGTLALRLAYAQEKHDGYVDYQKPTIPSIADQQAAAEAAGVDAADFQPLNANLFVQGGQKYSAQDQTGLRLSLLWRPGDQLEWNASLEHFMDRGTPGANLMQKPRAGEKFWSTLADTAPYLHRDVTSLRSRLDYDLSDYLNLAYIAGYSWFSGSSDYDQDGGTHVPTSFASGATYQEDRTNSSHYFNYTHEVDLSSREQHTVDWILGLYYAAERNDIRFDIPIFNGTQQGTVAWQGSFIQPKETVKSKAVFGQATFNASDRVHLTGGLRYTKDERANIGGTNNAWCYCIPATPIAPSLDPLDPDSGFTTYQHNDGHYSSSKVTWLGRLTLNFTPEFMAYASVSTGYKSGGLQDGGVPYGPETLTNYEIGTKNTLANGRVTLNNSAFYMDFKDFQFSAPVTFADGNRGLATSNAEGAKVSGFESELAAKVTTADLLQVSLSLLHTRLGHLLAGSNDYSNLPVCVDTTITNPCMDVTGHTLPHAPSATVGAGYEHRASLANDGALVFNITSHYEASSWLSVFNDGAGDKQKSYTRSNLTVRYESPAADLWSAELFVQNLEDGRIKTNAGVTSDNIYTSQYLPPRTFGANVRFRF